MTEMLDDAQPVRLIRIPGDPSLATRCRWVMTGVCGPNGERVRLRAWKIGGRLYTTPADVERFIHALNVDRIPDDDETPVETDADRLRRSREAGAALEALGC